MKRLDLLINNAGIGFGPRDAMRREISRDGHELRFAVNYLSGFLLTQLLLPTLAAQRAGADRQRVVGRATSDRLRRCDGDARL